MSAYSTETVLAVRHWTDTLFSFTTTRAPSFRFVNGQFTMLGLEEAGRPLLRAYSIASPNYDDTLEFFSIKVPDGPLTSRLQNIRVSEPVLIGRKPTGTLVIDNLLPGRTLYLLSTGTGLAPFLSIIRDPETYERFETVVLVHGCRQVAELAYGGLLERMRLNPKRKGLVFLEALKPATASGWQPALRPGLGSLGKEADDDRLQIALLEIPGTNQSGGFLTTALLRQLQGERIRLPQFASLVQEDVSFDTYTRHVPLVFGSLGGALELRRLSKEELAAKQQKCVAGRERIARDEPTRLAGPTREASRTFWHWFCPELQPPATARPVPIEPRASRQARPDDREPAQARRSKERERAASRERSSPQRANASYGSGGASGARAAASAVPTP